MFTLRWLLPALLPVVFTAWLARAAARRNARREPPALVAATFVLGAIAAALATTVVLRAATLAGLDLHGSLAGQSGAVVFLLLVVAPLHEAAKVAAAWPTLLWKHLDEPYDGIVYAAAAALGFSSVLAFVLLHAHPVGGLWIVRALLAMPAEIFLACLWGYALGQAKRRKRRASLFPGAFVLAVGIHGLYAYFIYGRGPGALLGVSPLLVAMGVVTWLLSRDLQRTARGQRRHDGFRHPSHDASHDAHDGEDGPSFHGPPSLSAVRAALRRTDEPVKLGWIAYGSVVIIGGMIAGLCAGVLAAHVLHIDLSAVDEHDVTAASPAILLGVGLLASFPTTGWLIARGAAVHTLLEPALSTLLALALTLVALGFIAPFTVVFALALSPVAWILSCIGAWAGRVP
ncbi:MAG TPA: PrsW family glutamic-type intramembrane protease [Polyangiaceae bacterium]|jgi:RsiW-degrading membrane proteinase PrsW (M82 family)|nr:PrsW family glutamic-type intramembrane protease [Polyangiaceae bacterium]